MRPGVDRGVRLGPSARCRGGSATSGTHPVIRLTGSRRSATGLAWLGLLIVSVGAGAHAALAADPGLTLQPTQGAVGSLFAATYTGTVPAGVLCPAGTVDFWWDAAGPGSTTPGAKKLGSAAIQTSTCRAVAPRLVVPKATCGSHVVYAFRSANGNPLRGTTATAAFKVTGCATASPTPRPPTPPPATAQPPATVQPTVSPLPTVVTTTAPTEQAPSATPNPASSKPAPTIPPLPPPPPPPSGPDFGGILILVILGLLPIGAWAGANLYKLGFVANGGAPKWLSLGLAVLVGGGLVGLGSQKLALKPVTVTVEFAYTGGPQWWVVPEGNEVVHAWVMGAAGGAGCPAEPVDFQFQPHNAGGHGDEIGAKMAVTPGQVLQINVGGKGHDGECDGYLSESSNALGGFNGGGAGGAGGKGILALVPYNGGGGGGASDVRHAPYSLTARDVVAGGGGGGGGGATSSNDTMAGGPGGCPSGKAGPEANGQGGGGGVLTMGGIGGLNGGNGSLSGEWGTFGVGGAGADHGNGQTAGGGGGGGWNGGGGGGSGAGSEWGGGGGGGGCRWPEAIDYLDTNSASFENGRVAIQYTEYVSILWNL
jgi:hypothetical protein